MLEENELQTLKSRLKDVFSDYYEMAGGQDYRFHHLTTARKLALKIAENIDEEVDKRVLEVAVLFHDIGRKEDIEEGYLDPIEAHEGHAETGEGIVSEFVSDFLSDEEVRKVEKIVGNHHSEAETVEGKVLQDADLLDNYGVSDLWRMIHYASDNKRTLDESIDYFWQEHLPRYSERLEEFYFDFTRKAARERMIKHQKAIRQISREHNAEDL